MMERWKDTRSGRSPSTCPSYHRSVVSLAFPREVEPHEQDFGRPLGRERPECMRATRLFDCAQRLYVELVDARVFDEAEARHRTITMHEEADLGFQGRTLVRPL